MRSSDKNGYEPMENITKAPAYAGKLVGMTDLKAGQTVRVHELIKDVNAKGEERERVQIFEGLVLGVRGMGASKSFTIRKSADGWGVEKIYPMKTPLISKVDIVSSPKKVHRAKLYWVRKASVAKIRQRLGVSI